MSQVNTSMNFLPEDYVEKRQAARAAVLFIGLLFAVVGGIVGAYLYQQRNMQGIVQKHDQVLAAVDDASKKIAEAQELEKQKEKMIAKADVITTLMERVHRFTLLYTLAHLRPQGVEFVDINLTSKPMVGPNGAVANTDLDRAQRVAQGLPDSAAKPPDLDVTVNLVGTAPTDKEVGEYMSALHDSPLLTDVKLLYSEEFKTGKDKDEASVRKFNVEMHINPAADLRNASPVADADLKDLK